MQFLATRMSSLSDETSIKLTKNEPISIITKEVSKTAYFKEVLKESNQLNSTLKLECQ